jgi:hypothetical protein
MMGERLWGGRGVWDMERNGRVVSRGGEVDAEYVYVL